MWCNMYPWDGLELDTTNPGHILPLETNQLRAAIPLWQLCVFTDTTLSTFAGRAVAQEWATSQQWQGQQPNYAPAKLRNWWCWNICFYSGYIYEFFNATCGCSCSNDYYRNVAFFNTINIDCRIPLSSNKYGYGLAKGFTKMKFYQLLN